MLIPIFLNFCCMKIWYDFVFRDLVVFMKTKYFFMFWRKPGILILDLYLYSIKIQTNIDQNVVKNTRGNHKYFKNIFLIFFGWAGPSPPILGWAGPALPGLVNKNKQWRTLHCSHATWIVEQPSRGRRRRRREVEAYLAVIRFCGSWSCRLYVVGWWFCSFSVLFFFFLCSFFSPLLSPVSPFVCDVVVDGGLRWHWWLQTVAFFCDGGQCLLLFDLPVCGEA